MFWRRSDGPSCGFQDAEHAYHPAEEEQSTAGGGNMLVLMGAQAEEI